MKYKALLIDFYGTLVEDDDFIITTISQAIAEQSPLSPRPNQIRNEWQRCFQRLCHTAYAENFKMQRTIEIQSLKHVLDVHQTNLSPISLAERFFSYWQAPQLLADSINFINKNKLPFCIVSNIDTSDLKDAIRHNSLNFDQFITSEQCHSYKPRPEMFQRAIELLCCSPKDVLHIGDSLTYDVLGAQQLRIDTAWINRKNSPMPSSISPPTFVWASLSEFFELSDNERCMA